MSTFTNTLLVTEPTANGRLWLFRHAVGQTVAPAQVVGKLRNPVEQLDPRTGKPRVVAVEPDNPDTEWVPSPIMIDKHKLEVSGNREFELAGDIVELIVDGVTVWSEQADLSE